MKAELSEAIRQEEEVVRYIFSTLSTQELSELERSVRMHLRSPTLGVILWALCGLHLVYLKDYKAQIFFLVTLGGLGIWWLLEAWVLRSRIRLFNLRLYRQHATKLMANKRALEPEDYGAQTIVIRRNK